MAVSEETRRQLFECAGGRCECTMVSCDQHRRGSRCTTLLRGGWHAHHRTAGGPDYLGNLTAMCVPRHRNTRTYGG